MHEVAWFIHFYPAYKYRDVMEENSFRVLSMLEESYRIDAEIRLGDIAVGLVPHSKEGIKTIDTYNEMANGGILDLVEDKEFSTAEEFKKALGQ